MAGPRVVRYHAYLRRSRHGNEGQGVGQGRYQRPERGASTKLAAVTDGISESLVVQGRPFCMLLVEPWKSRVSLAPRPEPQHKFGGNITRNMLSITYQPLLRAVPKLGTPAVGDNAPEPCRRRQ